MLFPHVDVTEATVEAWMQEYMPCRAERVVSEEVTSKRINSEALADSEAAEVTASACATVIQNALLECAVPDIQKTAVA